MAPSPSPLALLSRGEASRFILAGADRGRAERVLSSEKPQLCLRQPGAALPATPSTPLPLHSSDDPTQTRRPPPRLQPPIDVASVACVHVGPGLSARGFAGLVSSKARHPTCEPERERRQEQPQEIARPCRFTACGPWWLAGWIG